MIAAFPHGGQGSWLNAFYFIAVAYLVAVGEAAPPAAMNLDEAELVGVRDEPRNGSQAKPGFLLQHGEADVIDMPFAFGKFLQGGNDPCDVAVVSHQFSESRIQSPSE